MVSKRFAAIVNKVIQRHGAVIDLKKNPEVLLEIFRGLGSSLADEPYPPNNPCGGTPPNPGPTQMGADPLIREVVGALQNLTREVRTLKKQIESQSAPARASQTKRKG